MLTDTQADHAWVSLRAGSEDQESADRAQALRHERKWRQFDRGVCDAIEDIAISRWTDLENASLHGEATTPPDRYFIAIALKSTRVRLTRGRQTIFDGIMPAGTLYISAPSRQLTAQFNAPFDFLHFHVATGYFPIERSAPQSIPTEDLDDLILPHEALR